MSSAFVRSAVKEILLRFRLPRRHLLGNRFLTQLDVYLNTAAQLQTHSITPVFLIIGKTCEMMQSRQLFWNTRLLNAESFEQETQVCTGSRHGAFLFHESSQSDETV